MNMINPLEQLLYPPSAEKTRISEAKHPYEYGMFISINNHKSISGDLINQFSRQHQTLVHSICSRKISRENIRHIKGKPPTRGIVADLVAEKKLLTVAGIHDYKRKDARGGSRSNSEYQHTHFYVYGAHYYLPSDKGLLKEKEQQICRDLQRYTNTTNKRYCLIKITPVGSGIYAYTDAVTPTTLYDYLLTASPVSGRRTLLNYISNNRNYPQNQYPLSYLYEG